LCLKLRRTFRKQKIYKIESFHIIFTQAYEGGF
jgi:hypothetical protein